MSFGTGCKFQSYSFVVHSGVGGSGAAEMRMNGLRDDPPDAGEASALSATLTGLTINVWVVSMQPFSLLPPPVGA